MEIQHALSAVENRAFSLRLTMTEVCTEAGIQLPTWSRAKRQNRISVRVLRSVESALDRIEQERANA